MKKWIIGCSILAALAACGGSSSKEKGDKPAVNAEVNPDYQKGLELVANYKCMTCHMIDETLTGPSYKQVAKKYAGGSDEVVNQLANKIIQGGAGVWGELPMQAHPEVSQEDAKAMVKYILLLNK